MLNVTSLCAADGRKFGVAKNVVRRENTQLQSRESCTRAHVTIFCTLKEHKGI